MIRLTPLQIAGGVLAVLGGLAAVVQLLDYVKSGKLNLILASIVGAVAVGGVATILVRRARRDACGGWSWGITADALKTATKQVHYSRRSKQLECLTMTI